MTQSTFRLGAAAALGVFSVYAFVSVPIVNSAPTFFGPFGRTAVVGVWLYLAVRRAPAQIARDQIAKGLAAGVLPIVPLIVAFLVDPKWSSDTLVLFAAVITYGTICCFFALSAPRYSKAIVVGLLVLLAQLGVDALLWLSGLYGPYRFHI